MVYRMSQVAGLRLSQLDTRSWPACGISQMKSVADFRKNINVARA